MLPAIPQNIIVPSGFHVCESGTHFGSECLTHTPLWVSAHTQSTQHGTGIEVRWLCESGQCTTVLAAALLLAPTKTFARVLQHLGITIESRELKLRQYLVLSASSAPSKHAAHTVQLVRHGRVWRVHYAN